VRKEQAKNKRDTNRRNEKDSALKAMIIGGFSLKSKRPG